MPTIFKGAKDAVTATNRELMTQIELFEANIPIIRNVL